ncbi:MAG: NUDIX domain-containing protein [Anaerolineae bacterium]
MNVEALAAHPRLVAQRLLALAETVAPFTPAVWPNSDLSPPGQAGALSRQLLAYLLSLGLLEADGDPQEAYRVPSPAARTALRSLSFLAADGAWSPALLAGVAGLRPRAAWGVPDLIRLEQLRLEVAAASGRSARPLRARESALLIIKKRGPAGDRYLLMRRNHWPGYSFVGGKFEAGIDKTLTDTARREAGEEMNLDRVDFSVEALPLEPVSLAAISQRKGMLTRYTFHFFQLFASRLEVDGSTFRWFGEDEIRPEAILTVEAFGHLAYPEIQRALWHDLPGGLGALPSSDLTQK